jgi:glycosyltransferase involved in cell wall biosynthesis
MHQYTADLANRAAAGVFHDPAAAAEVGLLTTTSFPRDRYAPAARACTPLTASGTGFGKEGLDIGAYRRVHTALLSQAGCVFHFTGVHLWNVALVRDLVRRGVPVIHTLHDLDPHHGVRFGRLIRLWHRLLIGSGAHILVHARRYRDRLTAGGLSYDRVTAVPLLHGFWGWQAERRLAADMSSALAAARGKQPPVIMFFGRIEVYKGVDTLLAAWRLLSEPRGPAAGNARLVIAGPRAAGVSLADLPPHTEVRDHLIADDEAIDLFRQASLLVLPYRDATQSALIAAAYRFGVPVLATATGAFPEYVIHGETGWLVPPGDPVALAAGLATALADPDCLPRMGDAGRMWYGARRAEEEIALRDLYGRLAAGQTS